MEIPNKKIKKTKKRLHLVSKFCELLGGIRVFISLNNLMEEFKIL